MATALIVDDHAGVRELYQLYFEDEGFAVSTAADGTAAIRECLRNSPNVMLLDVQLPDISGLEVLRYIRVACPDTAVIMNSGHMDQPTREEAMRLGAVACFEKPFRLEELRAVLGHLPRAQ